MLHKNFPKLSKIQTFFHSFCESEIWEGLLWVVLAQVLSWSSIQDVNQGYRCLSAWLAGGFTSITTHSHTWVVSSGVWTEVSVPRYMNVFLWLLECPHDMALGFPEQVTQKRAKTEVTSYNAFYHLLWKYTHHFCHIIVL